MEEYAFLKGGDGVRYLEAKFSSQSWRTSEKAPCLTAVWLEGRVRCWYVVDVRVLLPPPPLEHRKLKPKDVVFQPLFID